MEYNTLVICGEPEILVKICPKGKIPPEKTSCGYNNNNINMYLKSTGYIHTKYQGKYD
jgi:hypothetical protein